MSQPCRLQSLPFPVLCQITDYAVAANDVKARQGCKWLCKAVDENIRMLWEQLKRNLTKEKRNEETDLLPLMTKLETAFLAQQNNNNAPKNYLTLFKKLSQEIEKQYGTALKAPHLHPAQFSFLQLTFDIDLLQLWMKVYVQVCKILPYAPHATQIRAFLNEKANGPIWEKVNVLGLNGLQLKDAGGRRLQVLPMEITNLTNLTALDISHNLLKRLPNLSALKKLEVFFANDNQLEELPELSTSLKKLDISSNRITELPDLSTKLEWLLANRNRLTELPDLSALRNLIMLDVSYNQLAEPPDVRGLTNLKCIAHHNSF